MTTKEHTIFRKRVNWRDLYFYQKADTLYQLTAVFCKRFLPPYGDRTVDQMIQAARSGKQNIVEGIEDGMTSAEMEIKLINVARSSIQELREDYEDYLKKNHYSQWEAGHPRYDKMLAFCREYNEYDHFEKWAETMTAEEFANMCITLCHLTDKMVFSYLERLQEIFVKEGGIKERMYAARTGYRQQQDQQMRDLQSEVKLLRQQLAEKDKELAELKRRLEERG